MATRVIYNTRDLDDLSDELKQNIDKAILAAAYKVRDDARQLFLQNGTIYKNRTNNYNELAEGIMVGVLKDGKIKIHALGKKSKPNTYKTRFFVGGTIYRENKRGNKGLIKDNDALEKAVSQNQTTLNDFINKTIENTLGNGK